MAEQQSSKTQTQAFLTQMERQRLSKPCNRVIDLRGKVPGECQAYTFGGRTHYLDDRGYLLAKQLLDRFNGRYTVGVYETLLKALKKLDENDAERAARDNEQEILRRSATTPQLIAFDQLQNRKEARILYATAVKLSIDDVQYNAATNDITCSAIRLTMKRAHALAKGDQVTVAFPEFAQDNPDSPMLAVAYRVIKIQHDEKRTYLVLYRNRDDNTEVSTFFDNWTETYQSSEYLDLDNELYNIASRFYLRLYTRKLNSALLWLGKSGDNEPVKAFHLMQEGDKTLKPLLNADGQINIGLLPITDILQTGQDHLVVVVQGESFAAARKDTSAINRLLSWRQTQSNSHVFLAQTSPQHIDAQQFPTEMEKIAELDADYTTQFSKRLDETRMLVSITDITSPSNLLPQDQVIDKTTLQINEVTRRLPDGFELPRPTALQYHIQRSNDRFHIHTQIKLHAIGHTLDLTTLEVSSTGLSVMIPTNIDISVGNRVKVDFTRWQKQTTQISLTGIPFQVRNRREWAGRAQLGMQRITQASSKRLNAFLDEILERNRDTLRRYDDDLIHSQETHIFGSLLTKTLASIPLYFGLSTDKKRILQAIATTETNHARPISSLWQALAGRATQLSEILKNLPAKEVSTSFGLYCYKSRDQWMIATEEEFSSITEKMLFINRALGSETYHFYLLSMMPIQSDTLEEEADLHQQLIALRNHSVHKVKQIREILSDLFAIGILTDITDIIEAAYR